MGGGSSGEGVFIIKDVFRDFFFIAPPPSPFIGIQIIFLSILEMLSRNFLCDTDDNRREGSDEM